MITKAQLEDVSALNKLVNSAYRGESSKKGWTTEADLLGGLRTHEAGIAETISKPDKSKHEDGHPVVIMLGLSRDGHAVATLREHYRELGYDAMYFSEGSNTGRQGDLDD